MLRLLTDEHIPEDIARGLRRREPTLDIVRVQEVGLMATDDRIILDWAATDQRIVVTEDRNSLIGFAYDRVKLGLPMPGVFVFRKGLSIGQAIDALQIMAMGLSPEECQDRVSYVPL